MEQILPLIVAIPLLTAAALLAVAAFTSNRLLADLLALLAAAATTILCFILVLAVRHETLVYWFGGWQPRQGLALGICFAVDPAGAMMATLAGVLVTASLVFSWHYFETVGTLYHSLMMIFLASMLGFSLTGDLFNLFVFFELMGVAAYALTGYKIEETGPIQGGLNFLVMNSIGAFFVLAGLAVLYGKTGSLNMAQIAEGLTAGPVDVSVPIALGLLLTGFLVKSAIVPFHFWLPDAHAVAPAPVSVLFSGVMVELGLYAVARVYVAVFRPAMQEWEAQFRQLLLAAGMLTTVVGGIMCMLQCHLKRLLAFSTISHAGFVLAALLVPGAAAGAMMYIVGHGLIKGALFLCVGILLHRFNSVDELDLHGAGRKQPGLAVIFMTAGLGLSGAPLFATFMGKAMIEAGAPSAYAPWLTATALVTSILTGGTVLRVALGVFLGWGRPAEFTASAPSRGREERETDSATHRIPWVMWAPPSALVILAVLLSIVPGAASLMQDAGDRLSGPYPMATVLLGVRDAYLPSSALSRLTSEAWLMGFLTMAGAAAIAIVSTQTYRLSRRLRDVLQPLSVLRRLHSGYVGDYAAWFMAGAAVLLVVLAIPVAVS
ncbi:MAG: complex I subunit 5 family protein [Solirubrobacterales bacterium]